jgi:hypothetical protein
MQLSDRSEGAAGKRQGKSDNPPIAGRHRSIIDAMIINKLTFSHSLDMVRNFAVTSGRLVPPAPRQVQRMAGA